MARGSSVLRPIPIRFTSVLYGDAIEHFFVSTEDEARPLTELYERLEAPPYGVKAGLIPLLFVAAYLANAGEVSLYEHGNYVVDPDIAVFERMLRQPGYFSVRRSRVAARASGCTNAWLRRSRLAQRHKETPLRFLRR